MTSERTVKEQLERHVAAANCETVDYRNKIGKSVESACTEFEYRRFPTVFLSSTRREDEVE